MALSSVELFVGAGGLALGTAAAGFTHEKLVEWDDNAARTIRRNKADGFGPASHWDLFHGDVRDFDFRPFKDRIDVVTGGPPCQPFSLGGKHQANEDSRDMFPEAIRAVRDIRPKAFIFENVKGLLRSSFSNYFNYIIQRLRYPTFRRVGEQDWLEHLAELDRIHTSGKFGGLKYNVVFQLLNAADYGVPQRRERVIIVGIRSDLGAEFSYPDPTHEEDALIYSKWVSGEYWERHGISKSRRPQASIAELRRAEKLHGVMPSMMRQPWRTVRDAIADLPRIAIGQTSSKINNHFLNPGARSYPGHNGSPWDEPAKTLKAGDHGVPGGENTLRFDDGSVRYFSVRECARLQTFPDEWTFEGSWTESMRQLGNAVPVRLIEQVAKKLRSTLEVNQSHGQRTLPLGYARPVSL